jgi:hypothetical protein
VPVGRRRLQRRRPSADPVRRLEAQCCMPAWMSWLDVSCLQRGDGSTSYAKPRQIDENSRSCALSDACWPAPMPACPCPRHCRSLQCEGCPLPAVGTLPAAVANLTSLTALNLHGNSLRGTLPPEWGAPGALPALQNL